MKTPNLDHEIERLSLLESNNELSEYGKELIAEYKAIKQALSLHNVSQQRELLIAFLEMNNWLSLEDEENAKGVVDCYLKAINCG